MKRLKRARARKSERGNVFFTLFGAVAVVGLLGAGIMATMRGPLTSMVEVQKRTQAESEMTIAGRLALLESIQVALSGDCDGDGFVEPLEHGGGATAPAGGGEIPGVVSSNKLDPWGTEYGYCSWDPGPDNTTCPGNRLLGTGDGDESYIVISIISAGPDRTFQTTCAAAGSVTKTGGSDDFWQNFTYAEATSATGGLWTVKSGDPSVAEIDKKIEVEDGAAFSGDIDLTGTDFGGASAQLQLGARSMLLPTDGDIGDAECNGDDGGNQNLLRLNTGLATPTIEVCDNDGAGTWVSATAGSNIWQTDGPGGPDEIYYMTDNVGIGLNDPTEALEVSGNIKGDANLDIEGDVQLANGESVVWDSGSEVRQNLGIIFLNANGGVGDEVVIGNSSINLGRNTIISGNDATNASKALVVRNSSPTEIFTVRNDGNVGVGVPAPDDTLDVDGTIDSSGTYKIDGDVILDNQDGSGVLLVGQGSTYNAASGASYLSIMDVIHADPANQRVGIGWGANKNVGDFNDALEVNGTVDIHDELKVTNNTAIGGDLQLDGNANIDGDITATDGIVNFGDDVEVAGTIDATGDITTSGGTFLIGSDDLTPPDPACDTTSEKVHWDGDSWECIADSTTGAGADGTLTLEELLLNGDDAEGEDARDFGRVGADEFCNDDLSSCVTAGSLLGSALWEQNGGAGGVVRAKSSVDYSAADFVFGSPTLDYSTEAVRMFFDKSKGAFRVGFAENAEWDDATVGSYSMAWGSAVPDGPSTIANRASGFGSTAWGSGSQASGTFSTAWGGDINTNFNNPTHASGQGSTAFGLSTTASGDYSTAWGLRNTASGDQATAWGLDNNATGLSSTAFGREADVGGDSSIAIGLQSAGQATDPVVTGDRSMVLFMDGGVVDANSAFDLTGSDLFAIIGGRALIDPTSTEVNVSTGMEQLELDVTGDIGAEYFCDEDGNNCFAAADVAGGGGGLFENTGTLVRAKSGPVTYSTDDFVFGSPQLNDDTNGDHDRRIFFDKDIAAFRAGHSPGTNWDTGSLGGNSFAMGYNTTASGGSSGAWGHTTTATADYATAFGDGADATGTGATAWGLNTTASGQYATAFGSYVTAGGYGSFIAGTNGSANGQYAMATGIFPIASGFTSYARGMITSSGATASGSGSTAWGYGVIASGFGSTAKGSHVTVGSGTGQSSFTNGAGEGSYSMAFGLQSAVAFQPRVTGDRSAVFFYDGGVVNANSGYDFTDSDKFALVGGEFQISETQAQGAAKGCIRFNAGTDELEFSDDCTTYSGFGANATAPGNDREIFFNDSGSFGTDTNFVFTSAGRMGIGTAAPDGALHLAGTGALTDGIVFGDGDGGIYESSDDQLTMQFAGVDRWTFDAISIRTNTGTAPQVHTGTPNFRPRGSDADTGLGRLAAGDDTLGLFTAGTSRISIVPAGDVGIGDDTPDSGTGGQLKLDVEGPIGGTQYCDEDGNNCFSAGDATGVWEIDSQLMRPRSGTADYANDDFVFGSYQLDDTGVADHDARIIFDKSKAAFRAGSNLSNGWNDVNRGQFSTAFGQNGKASGNYSFAWGFNALAEGSQSYAGGASVEASGDSAMAFGKEVLVGDGSAESPVVYDGTEGHNSVVFGLHSASQATDPRVTGDRSFAIFMDGGVADANSTYDLTDSDTFAVVGGDILVDGGQYAKITVDGSGRLDTPLNFENIDANRTSSVQWRNSAGAVAAQIRAYMGQSSTDSSVTLRTINNYGGAGGTSDFSIRTMSKDTGNSIAATIAYDTDKATSGNDTGLLISKTDTSSPGTSLLLDAQTGGATQFLGSDEGDFGAKRFCDETLSNCFTAASVAGGSGVFEVNSNVVRGISGTVTYATDDFVFGSPTLDYDSNSDHRARMFFDKDLAAFRAGTTTGNDWDTAKIGIGSIGFGSNTEATGNYSAAWGAANKALGTYATAWGIGTEASGYGATAFGTEVVAGDGSAETSPVYDGTEGHYSVAVGLQSGAQTTDPKVTGDRSFAIFMDGGVADANSAVDVTASDVFVLYGGSMGIGTVAPNAELHISSGGDLNSTAGSQLIITDPKQSSGFNGGDTSTAGLVFDGVGNANRTTGIVWRTDSGSNYGFFEMSNGHSGEDTFSRTKAGASEFILSAMTVDTGNSVASEIKYTTDKATSGNDTGLLISKTDTASPGTSLLLDAQTDGVSKFSIADTGNFTATNTGGTVAFSTPNAQPGLTLTNTGSGDRYDIEIRPTTLNIAYNDGVSSSGITVTDTNEVGIGDEVPDSGTGGQLLLDVEGPIGGTHYCDETGNNCFTAASVAGGSGVFERSGTLVRGTSGTVDYSTDDFVFGSYQIDDTTNSDHDHRFFFDKSRAVFRAGDVNGTQWDVSNSGENSAAFGQHTTASGNQSFAMGYYTVASGDSATAFGTGTDATGYRSAAFGADSQAAGEGSMAWGNNTDASGAYSTAWGRNSEASGSYATAWGRDVFAGGDYSVAVGLQTSSQATDPRVSGDRSFAIFNDGGVADANSTFNMTASDTFALVGPMDFLVGSYQMDDTTTGNEDNRMFFDRSKGAFRAGTTPGTEWDSGSVGDYSAAFGRTTTASGAESTALGYFTTASGSRSVAMGYGSIASGSYSVAMGSYSRASGTTSVAMGQQARASGQSSVAIGLQTAGHGPDPIVSAARSMALFFDGGVGDANTNVDITETDTFALIGGQLMIDDDRKNSAGTKGCIRYNSGTTKLQFSHDCSAYSDMGSGGGGGSGIWEHNSTVVRISSSGSYATNDFVFGSPQLNSDGDGNHDSRVFFDKSQSAFRAGLTAGPGWDTASIGQYSAAFGSETMASGDYAMAWGGSSIAGGDYATAFGGTSSAGGNYSTAFGSGTTATALYATAWGNSADATNTGATAWGNGATANATYATAWGTGTASAQYATAFGRNGTASGDFSMAWGGLTSNGGTASGGASTAWGELTTATANFTTAWGYQSDATGAGATAWGNNVTASGQYATAFGNSAIASGTYASAWGNGSTANATSATAFGTSTTASGLNSLAFGGGSVASTDRATAWGGGPGGITTASGINSTAFGEATTASGYNSTAFGNQATVSANYSVAVGLQSGSQTTDPIVSGTRSLVLFMDGGVADANSAYDFTESDKFALIGGEFQIDSDASTAAKGCIRFNDSTDKIQFSHDCSAYSDMGSGGGGSGVFEVSGTTVRGVSGTVDYTTNDFVFGSPQLTDSGVANEDARMYFDKSLYAFRAGRPVGTEWDTPGRGSFAFGGTDSGTGPVASGQFSAAWGGTGNGTGPIASGNFATAWGGGGTGNGGTASGTGATAFGTGTTATTNYATAWGSSSDATGSNSTAFGNNTTASGLGATTWGNATTASGQYSTAFGDSNIASGDNSFAGGNGTDAYGASTASGSNSFAFGNGAKATGASSIAFGEATTSNNFITMTWGQTTSATGTGATAWGKSTTASGQYATAFGISSGAYGDYSLAGGASNTASGYASVALGDNTVASGYGSSAFGREARATGGSSVVFGLHGGAQTTDPIVSGSQSFAIFMDDGTNDATSGMDLTADNHFAVIGGNILVSDDDDHTIFDNGSSGHKIGSFGDIAALDIGNDGDSDKPDFDLYRARGTAAARLKVENGDTLGTIRFSGWDGNSYESAVAIEGIVDGDGTADEDVGGSLVFATRADGASSRTTHMTIAEDGTISTGTTTSEDEEWHIGALGASSDTAIAVENNGHVFEFAVESTNLFGIRDESENHYITINGADGDVGINTTTPRSQLTVGGSGSLGLETPDTDVQAGDVIGTVRFRSNESSATTPPTDDIVANIQAVAAKQHTGGDWGTNIVFSSVSSGNTLSERMTIADGGFVGIGDFSSDTIDSRLHIQAAGEIRLDGGAGDQAGCIRFDDGTDQLEFSNDCSSYTAFGGGGGGGSPAGADGQIQFNDSGAFGAKSLFVFDSATDSLAIGLSAPRDNLTVSGDTTDRGRLAIENPDTDVQEGEVIGTLAFRSNEASTNDPPADDITMRIDAIAGKQHTSSNWGTDLVFSSVETNNAMVERMRLDDDGHLGLGTANPAQGVHYYKDDAYFIIESDEAGEANIQLLTQGDAAKDIEDAATNGWLLEAIGVTNAHTSSRRSDFQIRYYDGTTPRDLMFMEHDTGNIGIGTRTPEKPLHIYGTDVGLIVEGDESDDTNIQLLTRGDASKGVSNSATNGWLFRGFGNTHGTAANQDDFDISYYDGTTGTDIMFIEHDTGNIGIGTDSPTDEMHLYRAAADVSFRIESAGSNDAKISFENSDNDWNVGAEDGTDGVASGNFVIRDATAGATAMVIEQATQFVGIGIAAPQTELHLEDSAGGVGIMFTNADGDGSKGQIHYDDDDDGFNFRVNDGTDAMHIHYDGNVGIGTLTPDVALDVAGDIEYTGTITDVSDRRLKTDIKSLQDRGSMLAKLDDLATYSFVMKDDPAKRTEFGMVAQEMEAIFPELVHTADDEMGTKSVNYVGLIAPMIEATKELRAENIALKTEISELKTSNAQIHEAVADLTAQVELLNKAAGSNTSKASIDIWTILIMLSMFGASSLFFFAGRARRQD